MIVFKKILFQIKKMGRFFSSNKEPKIKIFDCTPPGADFDYLRQQGTISLSLVENITFP